MLSTPKKNYVFSLGQSTQGILESVMSWSRQKKKHMSLVMYFGTVRSSVWIDTWMSDIGGFPIKWFPIALDTWSLFPNFLVLLMIHCTPFGNINMLKINKTNWKTVGTLIGGLKSKADPSHCQESVKEDQKEEPVEETVKAEEDIQEECQSDSSEEETDGEDEEEHHPAAPMEDVKRKGEEGEEREDSKETHEKPERDEVEKKTEESDEETETDTETDTDTDEDEKMPNEDEQTPEDGNETGETNDDEEWNSNDDPNWDEEEVQKEWEKWCKFKSYFDNICTQIENAPKTPSENGSKEEGESEKGGEKDAEVEPALEETTMNDEEIEESSEDETSSDDDEKTRQEIEIQRCQQPNDEKGACDEGASPMEDVETEEERMDGHICPTWKKEEKAKT